MKLTPILKDNLIRVGGRIDNSDLSHDSKYPVILTKNMPVSELILKDFHVKFGHAGRQFVLTKLREKYWLVSASSFVRKSLYNCLTCRHNFRRPEKQLKADLPLDRVDADSPPFTITGIDYFGPTNVKRGRSVLKRYGVIFTCLTVRAVHLEIANDLSTDSFILARRRFLARRGPVKLIRSNNGSNFVGASKELSSQINNWNQRQIHCLLLLQNINWRFKSSYSSHHGGAWKRLTRSVRRFLLSLSNEQVMDDETLRTLTFEVEWIMNARPLTRVSNDPKYLDVITQSHLLLTRGEDGNKLIIWLMCFGLVSD